MKPFIQYMIRVRVSLLLLILGLFLGIPAAGDLSRVYLPAGVESTLVPIARPKVVDIGHRGAHLAREGAVSEKEGVAIVDSSLELALAEYARLTQTAVLWAPAMPNVVVQFRGQDRPEALARELAKTLRRHGVQLVELDRDRSAAVGSNVRLLRGHPSGNGAATVRLITGVCLGGIALAIGVRSVQRSAA